MVGELTLSALPALNNNHIDGFDSYLEYIKSIKLLTPEEEYALGIAVQDNGDVASAQKLIVSHLPFVYKIAKTYQGYGLTLSDLVQEGTIGLMKAVRRFDPRKGVRLAGYSVEWIKSEINEFVIKNWRLVKIATTKAQRKLFFKLRGLKKSLSWLTKEEANSIAKDLDVSVKDVLHMENRFSSEETSVYDEDLTQELVVDDSNPEDIYISENFYEKYQTKLNKAIELLDPRSRDILEKRWLIDNVKDKAKFKDLALKHQVSIERISQIEKEAISFLKKELAIAD